MRGAVIDRARANGMSVIERSDLIYQDLETADEIFLTSSGRGIVPVSSLEDRRLDCPGPITARLMADLDAWLRSENAR